MNKSHGPTHRPSLRGDGGVRAGGSHVDQLAGIETAIAEIRQALEVQFKRIAAMQAQLDYLSSKYRNGQSPMPDELRHLTLPQV